MKIVVFGSEQRVGALVGDSVIDLNRADASLPSRLRPLIEAGSSALEKVQKVIDGAARLPDGAMVKLSSTKLRAPWPGLRIACAAGNYALHVAGINADPAAAPSVEDLTRKAREAVQWGFWKVPVEAGGPDEDLPFPRSIKYHDYEGEAAVVIGKTVKDFKGARIDDLVWGVTLVNDWSKREGVVPAKPFTFNLAKNFDGSVSIGPAIVVGEGRYDDIAVTTKVNGEVRQQFHTREMIWSYAEILQHLSEDFTFVPGDIISGGTGAGTASDSTKAGPDGKKPLDRFLRPGDVVEVSSPAIGVLRNKLV